jgi:hypothetical protein
MTFESDSIRIKLLLEQLNSMACLENRLPGRVFRPDYNRFRFIEFDMATGDIFWPVLKQLMDESGDDRLNVVSLDPDPLNYFFGHFKKYGALTFSVNNSSDDYYEGLSTSPSESPADALVYNSEVLTWFPGSLKWLIWAERSVGLGVIGARGECGPGFGEILNDGGMAVSSPEQAVVDFVSPNFRDTPSLENFLGRFRQNYFTRID